jgi:hypothetical protein
MRTNRYTEHPFFNSLYMTLGQEPTPAVTLEVLCILLGFNRKVFVLLDSPGIVLFVYLLRASFLYPFARLTSFFYYLLVICF